MNKLLSHFFLIFLITSIGVQPLVVFATSPVVDPSVTGTTAATTATSSTTTANTILKTIKDYGLDTVAYSLAQKLGQKMATMTINKTTGGASGDKDPNFISDFGSALSKVDEQMRDYYTTKLLTSTNPYAKEIAKTMLQSPFANQFNQFTLGNFLQNGTDLTTAKQDLSSLGENGLLFMKQLTEPQNTPFGASLIARSQLAQHVVQKKESENLKITSSGFLPDTKCNTSISDYKKGVEKITGAQNNINLASQKISELKAALAQARAEQTQAIAIYGNAAGEDEAPEVIAADEKYYAAEKALNAAIAEEQQGIAQQSITASTSANTIAGDAAGCIEEMIKNPIATTEKLTTDAGKFGMDMTKNIQGWGQIVAGLFVSLFNGFIEKGLSSLKADYGQVKKGNTAVGGPEQITQQTTNGVSPATVNFANTPTNIVDLRLDLEKSITITEKTASTLTDLRKELIKVPVRLAYLDICLPGPESIGIEKRMDDYYSQQTGLIQKRSFMGSDEKRNAYQETILSVLERDFNLSKSETQQAMIDDTQNIPSSSVIRTAINRFNVRKPNWTSSLDALVKAGDTLSQLREINSGVKQSLIFLKSLEPAELDTVPANLLPFTTAEWNSLSSADQDTLYLWASKFIAPELLPTTPDGKRKLVIKTTWDLWENPTAFFKNKQWSDMSESGTSQHANAFLDEKNKVRTAFNSLKDSIPSDWELSKNEQLRTTIIAENEETDRLIHDCDQVRKLIWGDSTSQPNGWMEQNQKGPNELLAHMITYADTYFESESFKGALSLPNVLNTSRSWSDDNCVPSGSVTYQAPESTGKSNAAGDHFGSYACFGNFGHAYGIQLSEDPSCAGTTNGCNFNKWLDAASNIYQSQPHISSPADLYWKSRVIKMEKDPNPYGTGWKVLEILTPQTLKDGGKKRGLFCRLSSVLGAYAGHTASIIAFENKNIYCSSKWTDLSIADAVASFITNQVK